MVMLRSSALPQEQKMNQDNLEKKDQHAFFMRKTEIEEYEIGWQFLLNLSL